MLLQLLFEVQKGKESLFFVETFLVLPVTSLNFSIVSGRVGLDQSMHDSHCVSGSFKECRQVSFAVGESIGELRAVVSLNALDVEAMFFEERYRIFQECCRTVGACFLKRFNVPQSGELVDGGILIEPLSPGLAYQAGGRNVFDINLDALSGICHLFVRLWSV